MTRRRVNPPGVVLPNEAMFDEGQTRVIFFHPFYLCLLMEKVKFMITKKTCVRSGRLCVRHAAGGDRGYREEWDGWGRRTSRAVAGSCTAATIQRMGGGRVQKAARKRPPHAVSIFERGEKILFFKIYYTSNRRVETHFLISATLFDRLHNTFMKKPSFLKNNDT